MMHVTSTHTLAVVGKLLSPTLNVTKAIINPFILEGVLHISITRARHASTHVPR
jgi:hypothetical protein